MDSLVISATASFNSQTTAGSVSLQAKEVRQGTVEATTTYSEIATLSDLGQALVLTNNGLVDVSVRLTFASTKYATFCIPSDCTVVLPVLVNVNSELPDAVDSVHVKTASGTADVTYIIVY